MTQRPPRPPLFPYTTLFRSVAEPNLTPLLDVVLQLIMFFMITINFVNTDHINADIKLPEAQSAVPLDKTAENWIFMNLDRKSTRLNSSHANISYAVFCLKKK